MTHDEDTPQDLSDLTDWQIAVIKQALEEDDLGIPGVPHEKVVRWLKSLGTDHELPPPTA